MRALILALAVTSAGAADAETPAPTPSPPSGCDTAESHQFDFWVGHWAVSPREHLERHVADSLIEKLYQGCGVRENWRPLKGGPGGSLNAYDAGQKAWRQAWVDSSGAFVEFKGGWDGKAMVLTGVWPQPGSPGQITRMTYTPAADGSVRQFGESSDDAGKTWQPSFDFIYRKAP